MQNRATFDLIRGGLLNLLIMIYGLTGGIACGKSTLAQILEKRGHRIIDSDAIAHRLMNPGEVNWKNVVDAFGSSILNEDQSINRRSLGNLIFSQPQLRQKLNDLTHPAIRAAWQTEKSRLLKENSQPTITIMIPLLFESHLESEFDAILCVGCSVPRQIERLQQRGFSRAEAEQRLNSQWTVQEKMNRSHRVFWNEGNLSVLERQVDVLKT